MHQALYRFLLNLAPKSCFVLFVWQILQRNRRVKYPVTSELMRDSYIYYMQYVELYCDTLSNRLLSVPCWHFLFVDAVFCWAALKMFVLNWLQAVCPGKRGKRGKVKFKQREKQTSNWLTLGLLLAAGAVLEQMQGKHYSAM